MSTEAFCNAVMADIDAWHKANFPDLFVQYENGPGFDEEPEATAKPWLDVAVRFYNGSTTSIGDKPWGRYTGTVSMYVHARQGEGTMLIGGECVTAKAGEMLIMPANVPHDVRAEARFKMLLIMVRE